jgi:hypothetical protein
MSKEEHARTAHMDEEFPQRYAHENLNYKRTKTMPTTMRELIKHAQVIILNDEQNTRSNTEARCRDQKLRCHSLPIRTKFIPQDSQFMTKAARTER